MDLSGFEPEASAFLFPFLITRNSKEPWFFEGMQGQRSTTELQAHKKILWDFFSVLNITVKKFLGGDPSAGSPTDTL